MIIALAGAVVVLALAGMVMLWVVLQLVRRVDDLERRAHDHPTVVHGSWTSGGRRRRGRSPS